MRTYAYLLTSFTNPDRGSLHGEIEASALVRDLVGIHTDATKLYVTFVGAGDLSEADGTLLDGGDGAAATDPPEAGSLLAAHDGPAALAIGRLVDCEVQLAALNALKTRLAAAGKDEDEVDRLITVVNDEITDDVADLPDA